MEFTSRRTFWLGLACVLGAILGLLLWPFVGAAWFADEGNLAEQPAPAQAWAKSVTSAIPGAFDWGSAHDAYILYGRIFAVVFLGLLAGVVGLHARQKHAGGRAERWGYRIVVASLALTFFGAVVAFYTPLLDLAFFALLVPGMLLTIVGFPTFAVGTWKARVAPRSATLLLGIGGLPMFPLLSWLLGHNTAAFIPIELGMLIIGAKLISWSREAAPASSGARVNA